MSPENPGKFAYTRDIMFGLPANKRRPALLLPKINLYPEDPFYDSIAGKILKWAVAVGRHIIIATEIVVIGSFAARFILDRQLTDLNGVILQKQSQAESYGSLESDFRLAQQEIKDVGGIIDQQGKHKILDVLAQVTPPDISYEQLSFVDGRLVLRGSALSNAGLSLLLTGLQRRSEFSNITLGQIESGESKTKDRSVTFTVSANYQLSGVTASPAPAGRAR